MGMLGVSGGSGGGGGSRGEDGEEDFRPFIRRLPGESFGFVSSPFLGRAGELGDGRAVYWMGWRSDSLVFVFSVCRVQVLAPSDSSDGHLVGSHAHSGG